MKSYKILNGNNGLRNWKLTESDIPKPGAGQVLIKVHAVSLNYRDIMITDGTYPLPVNEHVNAVSDGAGEIVEIGDGVKNWKVGDRVYGAFFPNWQSGTITTQAQEHSLGGTVDGLLAQYAVLPQEGIVRIPSHLSYEEASTLPCAAVTAWHALMVTSPRLYPGVCVLIQGTGGVSLFAGQFALAAGAHVIALSSSNEKINRLHTLGIKDTINYKEHPEWQQEVLRLTEGKGVDRIIEVGGNGTLPKSMEAIAYGGIISLLGTLTGLESLVNPVMILAKASHVQGILVGSLEMYEAMNRTIEATGLKPIISQIFKFSDSIQALETLKSASHFGKIVIRID